MFCVEQFIKTYKKDPTAVAFCPYRVCPIGAHSDHQHGKVTGLAIDKGIRLTYTPTDDGLVAEAQSKLEKLN